MSVVAGTLANGGRCPTTNERIFSPETVQSVLSVMFTCGMYDFSGQFSFSMGFPSKSGVAGACLIVVPNVMGICTWSPRLDMNGNSARGISFAKGLAGIYQLHNFDKVTGRIASREETEDDDRKEEDDKIEEEEEKDIEDDVVEQLKRRKSLEMVPRVSNLGHFGKGKGSSGIKINPLFRPDAEIRELSARLITACQKDDMITCVSITERYGVSLLNRSDYDGRTPLHLACSENHVEILKYVLSRKGICLTPIDRWGNSPLDDAKNGKHVMCVQLMEEKME